MPDRLFGPHCHTTTQPHTHTYSNRREFHILDSCSFALFFLQFSLALTVSSSTIFFRSFSLARPLALALSQRFFLAPARFLTVHPSNCSGFVLALARGKCWLTDTNTSIKHTHPERESERARDRENRRENRCVVERASGRRQGITTHSLTHQILLHWAIWKCATAVRMLGHILRLFGRQNRGTSNGRVEQTISICNTPLPNNSTLVSGWQNSCQCIFFNWTKIHFSSAMAFDWNAIDAQPRSAHVYNRNSCEWSSQRVFIRYEKYVRATFEWMFVDLYLCANAWYLCWLFSCSARLWLFSFALSLALSLRLSLAHTLRPYVRVKEMLRVYTRFKLLRFIIVIIIFFSIFVHLSCSSHFLSCLHWCVLVAVWVFFARRRKSKQYFLSDERKKKHFNCVTKTWRLNTHQGWLNANSKLQQQQKKKREYFPTNFH